jgi:hypothetical protein
MKFIISESRQKNLIHKYLDEKFEGTKREVSGDWDGVRDLVHNEIIVGHPLRDNDQIGYFWGNYLDVDFMVNVFGLDMGEIKEYIKNYVNEKFGYNFMLAL